MVYSNSWVIELKDNKRPAVFVELDREKARRQFHMLVDSALDHGPIPSEVNLSWADQEGNMVMTATVLVNHTLKMQSK